MYLNPPVGGQAISTKYAISTQMSNECKTKGKVVKLFRFVAVLMIHEQP